MLRKLLPLLLVLSIQPALADTYLLFKPGETVSTEQWVGPEPTAKQIAPCTLAKLWVPDVIDGKPDLDISHYINAGPAGIKRFIPEPPPP